MVNMNEGDSGVDLEAVQEYSNAFDEMCYHRHLNEENAYTTDNLFELVKEQLADASNYLRYLYIKVSLVEEQISSVNLGARTFFNHEVKRDKDGKGGRS